MSEHFTNKVFTITDRAMVGTIAAVRCEIVVKGRPQIVFNIIPIMRLSY